MHLVYGFELLTPSINNVHAECRLNALSQTKSLDPEDIVKRRLKIAVDRLEYAIRGGGLVLHFVVLACRPLLLTVGSYSTPLLGQILCKTHISISWPCFWFLYRVFSRVVAYCTTLSPSTAPSQPILILSFIGKHLLRLFRRLLPTLHIAIHIRRVHHLPSKSLHGIPCLLELRRRRLISQ